MNFQKQKTNHTQSYNKRIPKQKFRKYEILLSNFTNLTFNDKHKNKLTNSNYLYTKQVYKKILFEDKSIYINQRDDIFQENIKYKKCFKFIYDKYGIFIQNNNTIITKINYIPYQSQDLFNFQTKHIFINPDNLNIKFIFEENQISNGTNSIKCFNKFFVEFNEPETTNELLNESYYENIFLNNKDYIFSFINHFN